MPGSRRGDRAMTRRESAWRAASLLGGFVGYGCLAAFLSLVGMQAYGWFKEGEWTHVSIADGIRELLDRMQDGMMFHSAGDNVLRRVNRAENRQVIALRPAAREYDFPRTAPQQPGHTPSRVLDRGTRLLTFLVDRRSISELFQQKRPHCLQHLRRQRSGSIRVHVDSRHTSILRELEGVVDNSSRPTC